MTQDEIDRLFKASRYVKGVKELNGLMGKPKLSVSFYYGMKNYIITIPPDKSDRLEALLNEFAEEEKALIERA